jgi:hypothetical protein
MRELGDRLGVFQRNLILARQPGLTTKYNLVHDSSRCADAHIAELRAIHRVIDEAVVGAYGWTDLLDSPGIDHGLPRHPPGRPLHHRSVVRQEFLDRVLEATMPATPSRSTSACMPSAPETRSPRR